MCSVSGCEKSVTPGGGRGLCNKHYMRLRRTGTTDDKPEPRRRNPVVCSVDDCDRRTVAFGLCDLHYRRTRRRQRERWCAGCDGPIEPDRGSRAVWCLSCAALVRKLRPYDLDVRGYLAMEGIFDVVPSGAESRLLAALAVLGFGLAAGNVAKG